MQSVLSPVTRLTAGVGATAWEDRVWLIQPVSPCGLGEKPVSQGLSAHYMMTCSSCQRHTELSSIESFGRFPHRLLSLGRSLGRAGWSDRVAQERSCESDRLGSG